MIIKILGMVVNENEGSQNIPETPGRDYFLLEPPTHNFEKDARFILKTYILVIGRRFKNRY